MARTVDPRKHAAKRQHILDNASHLFAEQGYERTTTAQLCTAAGISLGNLYHYFRSKKQVFLAVLSGDEQSTRELPQSLSDRMGPLDALVAFIEHLAKPATAHPIVPQLVLEAMTQARRDSEVLAALQTSDDEEQQSIRMLLQRTIDAGEADSDLDVTEAAAWLSTLIGALYLDAATQSHPNPSRQLDHLLRTVRAYLRPAPLYRGQNTS